MKRKFSVLLVFSGIQILIAVLLLMNFPIPALAGSSWAWCDAGCGGCGIIGAEKPKCGFWQCDYCWCEGWYEGEYFYYFEQCPGAIPE